MDNKNEKCIKEILGILGKYGFIPRVKKELDKLQTIKTVFGILKGYESQEKEEVLEKKLNNLQIVLRIDKKTFDNPKRVCEEVSKILGDFENINTENVDKKLEEIKIYLSS